MEIAFNILEKALIIEVVLLLLFNNHVFATHNSLQKNDAKLSISATPFPPDFLFGTSSSALQYEGGADSRGEDVWDVFAHTPGKIADGSNADVATDEYHLYKEDVELLAELGVKSHKISILWARVLPKGRHGNINQTGIEYYKNFIDSLRQKGIEPFVTLNHYDMPQELEDRYQGWLSPEMREEFVYFAEVCFEHLGDGVKYWITFNEPNMYVLSTYYYGALPPNHCSEPFKCTKQGSSNSFYIAAKNIILAHSDAVNVYRNKYQRKQGGQIGISLLYNGNVPLSNSTADKSAVDRSQSFFSNWFLDPMIYGRYPKEMTDILGSFLPEFSSSESEKLKAAGVDFIGINHYTSIYVKDCLVSECAPDEFGNSKEGGFYVQTFVRNGTWIGEKSGLPNLLVYPPGMEVVLLYVSERYPNIPIYVTENGYCDFTGLNSSVTEILQDDKRITFFEDYLGYLQSAIRKGADVRGYFAWSLLDNFEWDRGYAKRLGLYYVDRLTLKRTPKLSAKWYKNFISKMQMDNKSINSY